MDKKRTDNWLVARRLQLPVGLTNYGSIRSVTYSGEDVNEQNLKKRSSSLPLAAAPQGSRQISPDTKIVGGVSPAVSYTNIISETGEEVKEQDLDKKRTDNWLVARRLQLPVGLTNYDSIRGVTYSGEDVKNKM